MNPANRPVYETSSQSQASQHERILSDSVGDARRFPHSASSEVVIFLAIRIKCREMATFSRAKRTMMEETLFAKRPSRPAFHSGGCHGNPIDASGFVRNVSADLLQAGFSKQLNLPRDVVFTLKTIRGRIVTIRFEERRAGDSELGRLYEFPKQELHKVGLKRDISVDIADYFIVK